MKKKTKGCMDVTCTTLQINELSNDVLTLVVGGAEITTCGGVDELLLSMNQEEFDILKNYDKSHGDKLLLDMQIEVGCGITISWSKLVETLTQYESGLMTNEREAKAHAILAGMGIVVH